MDAVFMAGGFEVRPAERRVLAHGEPVPLGARAFDLLLTLIEQRERVVGKDELIARVWPGVVVEENNLTVQISSLRKVLGNAAITTVTGHGYRFTLPLLSAE
ncbi:MAG: winged helix-turn-helix domain-containing protein, partial [Aquincola sp.]|nr:winged helix-turn-helix domain-containing protein [Aquincola sp.]